MSELSGIFLSFSPDEVKEINAFLRDNDYEEGGVGLKKCILDLIEEEEEEEPQYLKGAGNIASFIAQNPEMVDKTVQAFSRVLKKLHR